MYKNKETGINKVTSSVTTNPGREKAKRLHSQYSTFINLKKKPGIIEPSLSYFSLSKADYKNRIAFGVRETTPGLNFNESIQSYNTSRRRTCLETGMEDIIASSGNEELDVRTAYRNSKGLNLNSNKNPIVDIKKGISKTRNTSKGVRNSDLLFENDLERSNLCVEPHLVKKISRSEKSDKKPQRSRLLEDLMNPQGIEDSIYEYFGSQDTSYYQQKQKSKKYKHCDYSNKSTETNVDKFSNQDSDSSCTDINATNGLEDNLSAVYRCEKAVKARHEPSFKIFSETLESSFVDASSFINKPIKRKRGLHISKSFMSEGIYNINTSLIDSTSLNESVRMPNSKGGLNLSLDQDVFKQTTSNNKLLSFLQADDRKAKKRPQCSSKIQDLTPRILNQSSITFKKTNKCSKLSISEKKVVVLDIIDKNKIPKFAPKSSESSPMTLNNALADVISADTLYTGDASNRLNELALALNRRNGLKNSYNNDSNTDLNSNLAKLREDLVVENHSAECTNLLKIQVKDIALINEALGVDVTETKSKINLNLSPVPIDQTPVNPTEDSDSKIITVDSDKTHDSKYLYDTLFENKELQTNAYNYKLVQSLYEIYGETLPWTAKADMDPERYISPSYDEISPQNALYNFISNSTKPYELQLMNLSQNSGAIMRDLHHHILSEGKSCSDDENTKNSIKAQAKCFNNLFNKNKNLKSEYLTIQYEQIDSPVKPLRGLSSDIVMPSYSNTTI